MGQRLVKILELAEDTLFGHRLDGRLLRQFIERDRRLAERQPDDDAVAESFSENAHPPLHRPRGLSKIQLICVYLFTPQNRKVK